MKRAGHRGVVLGDRAQAAQVGVDDAHPQRPRPGHVGQREVGAGREAPGVVDGGPRGGEEAPREVALARRARQSRSAIASAAATVMPCP